MSLTRPTDAAGEWEAEPDDHKSSSRQFVSLTTLDHNMITCVFVGNVNLEKCFLSHQVQLTVLEETLTSVLQFKIY